MCNICDAVGYRKSCVVFIIKQKTAYEMRISDWSSDVCSSDLGLATVDRRETVVHFHQWTKAFSPSVFAAVADRGIPAVVSMHDYFLACPNGAYFNFPRNAPCSLRPLSPACIASNCASRSYSHKLARTVRQAVTARILERLHDPPNIINDTVRAALRDNACHK